MPYQIGSETNVLDYCGQQLQDIKSNAKAYIGPTFACSNITLVSLASRSQVSMLCYPLTRAGPLLGAERARPGGGGI